VYLSRRPEVATSPRASRFRFQRHVGDHRAFAACMREGGYEQGDVD
jgi:hypothetical protein